MKQHQLDNLSRIRLGLKKPNEVFMQFVNPIALCD